MKPTPPPNATAGHTPGPWTAEINETGRPPMHSDWRVYCEGSTPCRIKPIARLELRGQESEANARLVAAAPDMLEALRNLRTQCQESRRHIVISTDDGFAAYNATADAINKADGVIARATGDQP